MTEDAPPVFRLKIEPEPTPEEFVAILTTLQRTEPEPESEAPPSRWAQIARREQLRTPLSESWSGWKR
jgi:hypothetical protein